MTAGLSRELRQALLSPRAVAVIGQSNDGAKTAGRPLRYLRQMGYAGRVYPINARRDEVLGERAWPSLAALPEVPEHVYVVTPTDAALDAIEECGQAGVKVATVLADGFSEAGPKGAAREARLREIIARTGIRVVGPSSLGFVNLRDKVMLTANAAFDEKDIPAGRIFAASHSGTMIGALLSRGKARGIGFAGLVSVGNEVDLSIGEICMATLDDPGIDGYLLFLESLRNADALRAFALEAAARGKPILAYKLGRSTEARELAVSHTGALAGEDDIASAFLADCGIARVETFEGLIEGFPLLARVGAAPRAARSPRVAVITTTAGGATTVVDPLASRGIGIQQPSPETYARLSAAGIEVAKARIVDLTIAGARYEVMKAALDILLTAPEFDLVVTVVGSSARFHPDLAVKPIVDSAGAFSGEVASGSPQENATNQKSFAGKPIAAFLVPDAPAALAQLASAGVPSFRTPEACADAVAAVLNRRPPNQVSGRVHPAETVGRTLNELDGYAVLDRLGIPRAPSATIGADIAAAPELPFSYPVVAKILSDEIAHKSDVGGVALGIKDGAELVAAVARMRASVAQRRPGTKIERVLAQPMASGIGEVLIGYRVDRDVGPIVMVAAGGIFTEIYRDRALRLAPVDLDGARAMIAEVRGIKALQGFRGKPAGDMEALARAIVALSQLATDANVLEAEINPLIVRPQGDGVLAVDAVVRMA